MPYHPFPQTRWTIILSAKDSDARSSGEALEDLAVAYWKPIHAYLRIKGRSHEEAQDDTQGFFSYLLERDFLRNVQPQGGRFRNFLLVSLRRWMKDERNRKVNVMRRAETQLRPWDEYDADQVPMHGDESSPEAAFDRSWAQELVAKSMKTLEKNWENRAQLFQHLRLTVESPGSVEKYGSIAMQLGMTEGAVGKAAHDLRRQFAEEIRSEVRETVAREDDVESELRYLIQLLKN